MIDVLLAVLALAYLVVGAITDIKTREVPDWVSYSAIFAGVGIRLLATLANFDWSYIIAGAFGLVGFGIIAYAMFYLGQWGGGDSKLLIGLGALIGIDLKFGAGFGNSLLNSFAVAFLVWILIAGAVYGTVWIIVLAFRNRRRFSANARTLLKSKKYKALGFGSFALAVALVALALFATTDILFRIPLIGLAIILPLTFYLAVAVSAVEKCCMLKLVKPEQLTEGDWIVKDIWIKKFKKESLAQFLIRDAMIPKHKILGRVSRKLYCYSKYSLIKILRLLHYLLFFRNQKSGYAHIVEKLINVKSKKECKQYLKQLKSIKNGAKYFEFLKEVYNFGYETLYLCGPKDLGISMKQIRQLLALKKKGKLNKNFRVLIKNGIPFVPSFLIAYLAAMFIGNLLVLLI